MSNDVLADPHSLPSHPDREDSPGSPLARLVLGSARAPLPLSLAAFALLLTVGLVHVQDQGGFIGDVTPLYMAVGYYLVEIGAALSIPLVLRNKTAGWVLAALVSIGPFVAYILSRTVGLPGDPGDVGNWGYRLGTVSLVAESTLFVLCVACLLRVVSSEPAPRSGATPGE